MADGDIQGMLVRIEATTAQLRQEMARGESSVANAAGKIDGNLGRIDSAFDRTGKNATTLQQAISSAFTGIGAASAAAVAGLVAITSRTTEYAQEVKNLAALSNTSVDDFQRLAAGAKTVGIEQEKLSDIYKDMNDRVGEFLARGGGEMADFFKEIAPQVGVTADMFAKLSGPQALQLYYSSLEKAGLSQQQMTTYMEAVADEATALIPLLKDNGQGFRDFGEQAEKAGRVLSQLEIDRLVEVRQSIVNLQGAFDGASRQLVSGMLPGMEGLADLFDRLSGGGAAEALGQAIGFLAEHMNILAAVAGGKVAAAFAGYIQKLGESASASLQARTANIAEAASAVEVAKANQIAAQSAVVRAEKEAIAARGTAVQTQMSIQLAEARLAERAATTQLAAAQAGLKAASGGVMAVLGGPAGIAALAVGAGIAFLTMRDNTSTLEKKLGDLADPLDKLIERFNKLNRATQAVTLRELQTKIDETQRKLNETTGAIADRFESDLRNLGAAGADGLMAGLAPLPEDVQAALDQVRKAAQDSAAGMAVDWKAVADEVRKVPGVSESMAQAIEEGQIRASDLGVTLQKLNGDLKALTAPIKEDTVATHENNAAKGGMSATEETYLQALQKRSAALEDGNSETKKATRWLSKQKNVTEEGRKAILAEAEAADKQREAKEAATRAAQAASSAGKQAATEAKNQAKALADLQAQAEIAVRNAQGLAAAYLDGTDKSREFGIQQKVEEALLKAGAGARKEVEAAIRGQADAEDRLAVAKSAYDLGKETEDILAQATATLQGTAALEAYNVQKAMQVALAGKNVAVGSQEYEQLLAATKAQQEAVKIAKQASDAGSIMDRLYPEKKLLREYTEAQAALNQAMQLAPDKAAEYQDALRLLGLEYEQNKNAATAWGKFTEGAVDRVDEAFAGAWKNIGDGFGSFATSLKDGFKQLLAELAHMAITRPIVMQIGAALGVGGLSAQSGGLFGGGGGSGGLGLIDMASKAYSVLTGVGPAALAGYQSGGIMGGLQGVGSYYGNLASSAWGKISGWFGGGAASNLAGGAGSNVGYGLGQNLVSGNIGSSTMATSSAGGLSASAPYLSAISGAIMGYQNSGVKGAAAGAAGGYLGVKGGAAVGSYFGPIGTAVGAVIGGILGSVGGSKLFGGDWVTKDTGLSLAVEDGDFLGKRYEYQKKKGGLFGKNKKRTRYSALDPETQAALDATYDATEGSVLDLFDRLNVEMNDGVLDGLNIGAQKISTKDKTAEEIQAEIAKWFGGVADSMVSAVDAATAAGLGGYNFEGLTAFVQNLEGVNEVVRYLNVGMYDVSVAGGKLAEQLSAIAGGLDVLQSNAATYYGAFISESERMDDTLDAVTRAFVAANQTLPETRTGFRDMVESIDTTTQAGMQMFSTLMALSGQASTYYDILEQRASNGVNAAFAALQRSIAAQQKAINKSLTDANSRISDLTAISSALGSALKQLRGTGDDAVRMLRSQAQATLQSALAIAKAGGSLSGFAGLTDALDVLGSNNTDLYGSLEEFNRDQGRTANAVAELNKLNGKQLSAAEKSALAMQAQLDALDAQLEFAQAQVDALNGIDNSVKSVADAVKEMNAAVVAAIASISGKSTPQNAGVLIDSIYKDQLGRDADAEGKQYWVDQLASGALNNQNIVGAITNAAAIEAAYKAAGIAMNEGASYWAGQLDSGALTPDQLQEAVRNAAIANGSIPAYASGGLITGPGTGTSDSIIARLSNGEYVMSADAVRMFGTGLLDQMNAGRLPAFAQGGPVLDIPSPNQVFGSSRADVISGGSDNGALLAKFEQLLEANKSQRFQIAKYAQQVAQLLQKWDVEGAPKERDYA
nr:ATPase involved in DNA repair [Pseudomonas putida]